MPPFRLLPVLVLACWLCGCHWTWVRQVTIDMRVLNERNQLLTIEGRCNLPDGAVLEGRLLDKDGRRWAYNRGLVKRGRYFMILDISHCPGFRPLNLEVFFDPLLATAKVQRITGARGEALAGPYVLESHDRSVVMLRERVVLTMSARQLALRRLETGDGNLEELQSYLVRHPNDPETLLGLGLAYLKQQPSQRWKGSKAYKLLQQGLALKPKETSLEMEGRLWVGRLDDKARREEAERQRQVAPSYNARFIEQTLIHPGKSIGAFELGMPQQFLLLSFKLQATAVADTFLIPDFPHLRFTMTAGKVSKITSRDPRHRTQEGIGPGSAMEDLQQILPEVRPAWGAEEKRADGRLYSQATVELEGLNLVVERHYDPNFPLPEQSIIEVQVVGTEAAGAAAAPTSSTPVATP
jgi:hypothetical protein